jgi:phosphate butyryltransferase
MPEDKDTRVAIQELRQSVLESGYFDPGLFQRSHALEPYKPPTAPKIEGILKAQKIAQGQLEYLASFITEHVIKSVLILESRIREPSVFDELRQFMEQCLTATADFRRIKELATVYGDLLAVYILVLHRCGAPGRQSPILKMILRNLARHKAAEIDPSRLYGSFSELENKVTISLVAKRYAVYLLATRGFTVLLRSEITFRQFGTSPEELALQVINLLLKNGIKLAEVTDLVCGGGDMGTLPDGIYVLTEKVREESWKRLQNSSLNRGPLVTWELRKLLRAQSPKQKIHASVCSPLTFSTLAAHHMNSLFREESRELELSLKGYVKITPLKATGALLSEIEKINPESLNLLVMTLDELFACVVRKIGSRTVREMAAQEANKMLVDFDFGKICEYLKREDFVIPPHFRLASREIGTGVKEMCELIMIVESGKISPSLSDNLMYVVDSYARQVATVLEMASAGKPQERPDFILVTSTRARDLYFLKLFTKIRSMVDSSSTPIMCLDSLEYEYLTANHLFEMYVNPDRRDRRLHITVEARSMKHALQVLGSRPGGQKAFSFSGLLEEVTSAIADGALKPANLVLVGADNEDALLAVSEAKEQGLLGRLAFIGDPDEVISAIERARIPISPGLDPSVELIHTDPLAIDADSKKKSMAEAFGHFIRGNQDFIVIKGSIDTAALLHKALSIYRTDSDSPGSDQHSGRKMATSSALFALPDGRFFALSDAGVNPIFRNAEALLQAIENQVELVRKVVEPTVMLKLAIITAVEKVTSAIPATLLAAETQEKARDLEKRYGPLIVEGPLSFDLATVPDSALEKHYDGQIRGDANCLMATDINTANVLYKMMSRTMGSLGLVVDNGAIITAGPNTVPIVLTSRGDTARTKFNSILLALAYASKKTNMATNAR